MQAAYEVSRVALVGAGPGHPGLITLRGIECLQQAEFVLYDRLVSERILAYAPETAERKCVEELGPCHAARLPLIQQTLIDQARQGRRVVRLKGGDPMIFGRGGEEAQALCEAGLAFEIVPGVTAALGIASCAGFPLTHRQHASAVALVTGHEQPEKSDSLLDWSALARFPGTLVFYMGLARLEQLVGSLIEQGKPANTPAAVVERGTTSRQRTLTATLEQLPRTAMEAGVQAPALIVIGSIVSLREQMRWFESRPLFGKRVLVTRPRDQCQDMVQRIEALGGEALVLPTVQISPPNDWSLVDQAIRQLANFDWVVFTSVNGVRYFFDRLRHLGRDLRALGHCQLAVIGTATAEALRKFHLQPDLLPEQFNSESLAAALLPRVGGKRLLLARADRGLELLREELSQVASVTQVAVYSQHDATLESDHELLLAMQQGEIDFISLTSSNIALALLRQLPSESRRWIEQGRTKLVSISPRTSAAIRSTGLPVAGEASEYTTEGVLKAMCELAQA